MFPVPAVISLKYAIVPSLSCTVNVLEVDVVIKLKSNFACLVWSAAFTTANSESVNFTLTFNLLQSFRFPLLKSLMYKPL